eukprot:403367825
MLQSSLFWNKLEVPDQSIKQIEDQEGRVGHAMFYFNGELFIIGGEENTAKNWMNIKENARKSQMDVAGMSANEDRKRSQSSNPTGLNQSASLGFSLAGNRGANAANKNLKTIENYITYNIGKQQQDFDFILENKSWEKRKAKGKLPSQRCFFAYHYEAPYLFIHGGQMINQSDKKNKSQADLFLFQTDTQTWKRFFVFDQPTARDQHSLTKIGNNFYVYGGNISPENLQLDEMWMLNLDNVIYNTEDGNLPGKLKGHKVVAHPDQNNLILFGGQSPDFVCHNHVFYFNITTKTWRKVETKGSKPSGRCHHQMMLLGDSMILVFGGIGEESNSASNASSQISLLNDLHILNLKESHWIQPIMGGMTPSPRYGHVMSSGQQANEVYVFGGINENYDFCSKDMFLLYETSKQSDKNWKIVEDLDLNQEQQNNLEKADWEIETQKQKIAEIEDNIKRVQEEKFAIEEDLRNLDFKFLNVNGEIDRESQKWVTYPWAKGIIKKQRIQVLKFFQQKCMMLTDMFKNMENLLINIDKAVIQILEKDENMLMMDESFNQEFKKIEKERQNHKKCLMDLSLSFNKLNLEEEEIQKKIEFYERQAEIDRVLDEQQDMQRIEQEKDNKKRNTRLHQQDAMQDYN